MQSAVFTARGKPGTSVKTASVASGLPGSHTRSTWQACTCRGSARLSIGKGKGSLPVVKASTHVGVSYLLILKVFEVFHLLVVHFVVKGFYLQVLALCGKFTAQCGYVLVAMH